MDALNGTPTLILICFGGSTDCVVEDEDFRCSGAIIEIISYISKGCSKVVHTADVRIDSLTSTR